MSARLTPVEKVALLRRHDEDGIPWNRLAADAGVPLRTLQRWAAAWRVEPSPAGLRRQPRADRGTRHLPAELVAAIEGLALLKPAPTVAFIHRRIGDIARARGIAAPSYTVVRQIVASLDPGPADSGACG